MPLPLILLLVALLPAALAAQLPGVALELDATDPRAWSIAAPVPPALGEAGVQAGWVVRTVDGQAFDPTTTPRLVAAGPARKIQLGFRTPQGDTVVIIPRAPLVQVESVGLLPWPTALAGASLQVDSSGAVWARAAAGSAQLNLVTGALQPGTLPPDSAEPGVPSLWFGLTEAAWVLLPDPATGEAPATLTPQRAAQRLGGTARVDRFMGQAGEHLLQATPDGIEVWAVTFPRGTPVLPACAPAAPEACLVAGRAVADQMLHLPGGPAEADRLLSMACSGGAVRACVEAVRLRQPALAADAAVCLRDDANACHSLGRALMAGADGPPSDTVTGALEVACTVDASGALGERLRRLEDVGEGCMLLAAAADQRGAPDRALLSLDQACVLGRAEACANAARRRADAVALRTVRECEDPTLPLAAACVQLGRLLAAGPIQATALDQFGAWSRACALGDEEGCVLLGDFVDRWGITHPRVVEAERSLQAACRAQEQRACVGAGHLLVRHEPRSPAYGEALQLFAGACAAGLPSGCIAGAEQRRIGAARAVAAPDPVALWTAACTQASPEGCEGLGTRLARSKSTGEGAYQAWTQACDTGAASACTALGGFVATRHPQPWPGEQPPADYLKRGCDNGDPEGCFALAGLSLPRKGAPSEPTYLLLEQSCAGDFGPGCAQLGAVHLARKTSFDDEIAARRFEEACDNGHFESCKTLGEMYARGKGVEKDRVRARELAQRYAINASRRHLRLGLHAGFPYVAGVEGELVVPIPVGPALSLTGSASYLPGLGGVMLQLEGGSYPAVEPDLAYVDAGLRLYPNTKARGLYGMVGYHQIEARNGALEQPITRAGGSLRLGMHTDTRWTYTRVEMGIGQYGVVNLNDFDEDETGTFPLVQATLGISVGLSPF